MRYSFVDVMLKKLGGMIKQITVVDGNKQANLKTYIVLAQHKIGFMLGHHDENKPFFSSPEDSEFSSNEVKIFFKMQASEQQ